MHVGLNLVYLVPGATGGNETYARELIPRLVAAAPGVQITAFINEEATEGAADAPWRGEIPSITVPVHASNRADWVRGEQMLLPRLAARAGVHVVHSMANTAPVHGAYRRIVTIHDLHHRLVPEAHLGALAIGMRVLVTAAARRSTRVIVDAQATAEDVRSLLRVPSDRIDVIPLGYGRASPSGAADTSEVRRILAAGDRPIVLCVSAQRPHKNLIRLISALELIPVEQRPLLVIPGYRTDYEPVVREHIRTARAEQDVRLLGWISEAILEGLYAAAACVVCPSLHEGFGFPVLEAMSRGRPVACSGGGALAEVAGGAALLFEPTSVRQISLAIQRLIVDEREAQRLRIAGLARAGDFSWHATAVATLEAYERALAAPR